ncbi:S8 family serine peptidase [Muricauda sp. JGD-17]|uniref:S8 family serine peptidase n=1 Tax=Flagellimonas ochracea TaxID=2696472 RepID=A0A964TF54_9FLAO|nr:S8 family serine peptidase [Allomuricauda ochracea]NAY93003.1 S8 family serine peptidase [Allomuricauda ochracea]
MVTYRMGGKNAKKQKLKEADDLVVVRFEENKDFNSIDLGTKQKTLINNLVLVHSFPEANVNIYRCNPLGEKSAKQVRNQVRKMSSMEEDIKFSGRVLVDDKGTISIYTENIFVKFFDDISEAESKRILEENDLVIKKEVVYAKNAFFVESKKAEGKQIFQVAENLLDKDEVEYCHPELIRQKKYKNSIYQQQWHLEKTTFMSVFVDASVEVRSAWQHTKGEGIVIAVIDDSVDTDHPEFISSGKIVAPKDMATGSSDAKPTFPTQAHGTSCAGVACASGLDSAAGVAPESVLMPIKLNANLGSMQEAEAFVWAVENGADVISCSWGPPDGDWSNPSDPNHTNKIDLPDSTRLAIDYAATSGRNGKGCIITWAAGNGREDTFYDGYASYEKVLAIAACNDTGKRSVYSDFGQEVFCAFPSGDFGYPLFNHPKPLTPGIWTTDVTGPRGYNPGDFGTNPLVGDAAGNYTATFSGTSSACPGAAGVIALILAVNPNLNLEEVKEVMRQSCDKIDEANANYDANGHSIYYGYGRINARKSVENAKNKLQNV